MPLDPDLKKSTHARPKILLLGSGGLSIGQAGEFDYSGSQAIKALIEEGCDVVVVNPNIATVQTNPQEHVTVYLYDLKPHWIEKIIRKENPQGIVAGFGGQTALNCLIELHDQGILQRYGIKNLGTHVDVLRMTEDRDAFAKKMQEINMPIPPSQAVTSVEAACEVAKEIGYPVIVRAAYALGGLGSGFADDEQQLIELVMQALALSPQVLIEKSLRGWKEIEYEVMRDAQGNTITICNMENFDPLGIHTGDSIVVCPSQSLSDDEYQLLRNASLAIVNALGVVGECNVQLALDPRSLNFYVIEVNARLSRSSALASKASGYPIAYIAAKVVLGFDLLELTNPVTGVTRAFFEPALDYITMKIPRWDLSKFQGVSRQLGSTMKSVGEVMAIGRSFPEVLQKAVRMVFEDELGIYSQVYLHQDKKAIEEELKSPTDSRLFVVVQALQQGMSVDELHRLTHIDPWFLSHVKIITDCEQEIIESVRKMGEDFESILQSITKDQWRKWKFCGFSDEQLAWIFYRALNHDQEPVGETRRQWALKIRKARIRHGVLPVAKRIDTTAAEYPSQTNYFYMTYGGYFHDERFVDDQVFSAVVLGGGAYRIGSSVEFDWCAVSCSRRLRQAGWRSIVINCNPETVSTDFNSSDVLYFEEPSLERILDVVELENSLGVIVSMGGQLPNKLARLLAQSGVKLLGHSAQSIDQAEDRNSFSVLLDRLGIDQPRWISAQSWEEVRAFIKQVGYPVIVRPSYVLSGAAMKVAYNDESLAQCLDKALSFSKEHPVVVSEFITGAREIELDGVAQNGAIVTAIVSEHVENAGVHSGDATSVVPPQNLYVETVRRVRRAASAIVDGLKLNGPFNIQFLAKAGDIKVIECNARAARSFPFVSKVVGLDLAALATDVLIQRKPKVRRLNEDELPYVGVKAAMFSFKRLGGADPVLGVEMASTGEVGCIGKNFDEALLLALEATHVEAPKVGILVSSGDEASKLKFLGAAKIFAQLGLPIYATQGTADHLESHGINVVRVPWPHEADEDVLALIKQRRVDLVINIPKSSTKEELERGTLIRQAAVRFGLSLMTNIEKTIAFARALQREKNFVESHDVIALPSYQMK